MSLRRESRMLRLRLSGRGLADLDFWTKSDPFLTVSRPNRKGTGLVQVRKTETVMNNLNPDWKLLYIPLAELCDEDFNMPLKIAVWDEDKSSRNDIIGTVQVSLGELMAASSTGASLPLVREAEGLHSRKEGRGQVVVTQCTIEGPEHSMSRKASQASLGSYPATNLPGGSKVGPSQNTSWHPPPPQTPPYSGSRAPHGSPFPPGYPPAPSYPPQEMGDPRPTWISPSY